MPVVTANASDKQADNHPNRPPIEKPRRVEPPRFSMSLPRLTDRDHGKKLYWTRMMPAQIWVSPTVSVWVAAPPPGEKAN
jgi:hypothetical protein